MPGKENKGPGVIIRVEQEQNGGIAAGLFLARRCLVDEFHLEQTEEMIE